MKVVAPGDRVRILCASREHGGDWLDSDAERQMSYWIRAQAAELPATRANEAIVGMRVGERRDLTVDGAATGARAARTVIHELEVVAIAKDTKNRPD